MDTAHREDLISRSRAIKDISYWATNIIDPKMLVKEDALYILESLPSAEPKAGEWIPCTKNGLLLTELIRKESVEKWYGYKCSECNYIHKGNALIEYRYCPNCGARMNGGEEE